MQRKRDGRDPDATLAGPGAPPAPVTTAGSLDGERYREVELLGAGGMGEVHLVRDARIGREVARKRIRADRTVDGDLASRFVREARVQGQLEHPSIVPVYDVAREGGRMYFTMRRVRGLSLAEILRRARDDTGSLPAYASERRRLEAFSRVCLAVDYAHAKGVLHRDLKPSNIMLGEYGEVYVLDWGVAKITSASEIYDPTSVSRSDDGAPGTPPLSSTVGTFGYIAPEQLDPSAELDPRSDVYALGAILFEILTLQPLHARGSIEDRVASTLSGADARASRRAPERDVAPELEAICVKATAREPSERFASVHELVEQLERYLEGDRDLALRRALAEQHERAAAAAAARVFQGDEDGRPSALRDVGRALALDASNRGAMRVLVDLLDRPPKVLPEGAQAEVETSRSKTLQAMLRGGLLIWGAQLTTMPLLALAGVRDAALFVLLVVFTALAGAMTAVRARNAAAGSAAPVDAIALSVAGVAIALNGFVFGPLFYMPSLLALFAIVVSLSPIRGVRKIAVSISAIVLLTPLALEMLGLVPASYAVEHGRMIVLPRMIDLSSVAARVALIYGVALTIGLSLFVATKIRRNLDALEEEAAARSWQLRQLAPAHATAGPPSEARPGI